MFNIIDWFKLIFTAFINDKLTVSKISKIPHFVRSYIYIRLAGEQLPRELSGQLEGFEKICQTMVNEIVRASDDYSFWKLGDKFNVVDLFLSEKPEWWWSMIMVVKPWFSLPACYNLRQWANKWMMEE